MIRSGVIKSSGLNAAELELGELDRPRDLLSLSLRLPLICIRFLRIGMRWNHHSGKIA